MLLLCAPLLCRGQQLRGQALPVAPQNPVPATVQTPPPPVGTGNITGQVTDSSGALVPGAVVTFTSGTRPDPQKAVTDYDGDFVFQGVSSGSFHLQVTAEGLEPGHAEGTLLPGQQLEMPPIALRIAATDTEVDVTFTREELGVAEVQAEEKQRVLGFLPNFSVAYDWNAPPMTTEQKYHVAMKEVFDPVSLVIVAGVAGVQQAANDLPGYGRGGAGYGKRVGANLGNSLVGTFLSGAVLPQIFHQDPRYFWKGSGTVHARVIYAFESLVKCRGDKDGRWETNYSNIIGTFGAGALSNLYYPNASRQGVTLTLENGLIGMASDGVGNLIQEFLLHRITPRLPRATPAP
jgi:hypothetical protein